VQNGIQVLFSKSKPKVVTTLQQKTFFWLKCIQKYLIIGFVFLQDNVALDISQIKTIYFSLSWVKLFHNFLRLKKNHRILKGLITPRRYFKHDRFIKSTHVQFLPKTEFQMPDHEKISQISWVVFQHFEFVCHHPSSLSNNKSFLPIWSCHIWFSMTS